MTGTALKEGESMGRFVVLRDRNGNLQAVSSGPVGALCETEDGALLPLSGGCLFMSHGP